jgi:PAS domain S-box-containing protein
VIGSGSLWGGAAIWLFPPDSLVHQVFLSFLAGGLAAGSTTTNAGVGWMATAFYVPALAPLVVQFLLQGTETGIFMGGMLLFYTVMITVIARNMHRTTAETLMVRMENLGLISFLTEAKSEAEGLNEELKSEIHEREVAERALRESEEKFRALVENAVDGIMLVVNERYTYVNSALCKLLGHDPEDLLGAHITGIMADTPLGKDMIYDRYKARLAGQDVPRQYEAQLKKKDGTIVDVISSSSLSRLGGDTGVIVMIKDISEWKRTQQALRESEEKFRALVENAVDGIVLVINGRYTYANKAYCALLGYGEEELYATKTLDTIADTPLGRELIAGHYQARVEGDDAPSQYEAQMRRKDGSVVDVIISSARVHVGGRMGVIAMVKDMTEWKEIERMKSEFVSVVSHELRTPLTSIHASLGLIASGAMGEVPKETRRLVEVAAENSERLVRLTNDILDVQKIESGGLEFRNEPFEMLPLVKEALKANQPFAAQNGVVYVLDKGHEGAVVNADKDRVMQVMNNLLANAAKFSPPGEDVKVSAIQQEGSVRVAVTNRGPGIPEEFRKRIFEKFAQADTSDTRRKSGTGLGLSIARSIVEQLGGKLDFESVPNVNTTFYFDLPEYR